MNKIEWEIEREIHYRDQWMKVMADAPTPDQKATAMIRFELHSSNVRRLRIEKATALEKAWERRARREWFVLNGLVAFVTLVILLMVFS